MARREAPVSELQEKVVYINRVSKVVKGGRRFSLTALVVVGDGAGNVGVGMGKSAEVPDRHQEGHRGREEEHVQGPAHQRARSRTRSSACSAPAGCCSSRPLPVPASSPAVRSARCSSSPASHDVLSKSLGTDNALNMVKAAAEGLQSLSSADEIARRRGKTVAQIYGWEE